MRRGTVPWVDDGLPSPGKGVEGVRLPPIPRDPERGYDDSELATLQFAVDDADATRVQLLCEAMTKWGKGRIERRPGTVVVDVAPEAILELMEVQSGFPGAVRGLRVEEPTLDLAYDKLLGVA